MKKLIPIFLAGAMVVTSVPQNAFAEVLTKELPTIETSQSEQNRKSAIFTKDQIEKIVRMRLGIDADHVLQDSYLETQDRQQRQYWRLYFSAEQGNISVMADASTGEITSFDRWDHANRGRVLQVLPEEAKKAAYEFIVKMHPDRAGQVVEAKGERTLSIYSTKYYNPRNYEFYYVRQVGEELFPGNYFRVQVSGINGAIVNYEMKWDEVTYKEGQSLITAEKAQEIFENRDLVQIKYIGKYEGEDYKLIPVYQYGIQDPEKSGYLDATSGNFLNQEEIYADDDYRTMNTSDSPAKEAAGMDGGMGQETIPEEGAISKEEAEDLVKTLVGKDLDIEGLIVGNSQYSGNYRGIKGKYWTFYWEEKNKEEGNRNLRTVLDGETGTLVSVSYTKYLKDEIAYEPRDILRILKADLAAGNIGKQGFEEKAKVLLAAGEITQEEYEQRYSMEEEQSEPTQEAYDSTAVLDKVKSTLAHMNPNISEKDYTLEIGNKDNQENTKVLVEGIRYIHDIPFEENSIYVGYDKNQKEITKLNYTWYNVPVEKPSNIIEKVEAEKLFFDAVGIEKYLIQLKDQEKSKEFLELPQKELVPVYAVKQFDFRYIDAQTGELLGYNGDPYEPSENRYVELKDIEDSQYRDAIVLMNHMNYIREQDGQFNISESLSRKDAIKWVYLSLNQVRDYIPYTYKEKVEEQEEYFKDIKKDDPYYEYIIGAAKQGILDLAKENFYPDKDVTKQDITRWILNALGQKPLAQYSQIFVPPYKDKDKISKEEWGYMALADYYEIYGKKNASSFEPDRHFQRDEFVGTLYNLLKNLEEQGMLGY